MNASTKQWIVIAVCVAATVASGGWIYFRQFARPEFNVALHRAVGQVLAEETDRLLGQKGTICVISLDTPKFPELKTQLDEFQATLKRLGKIEIKKTYFVEMEEKQKYGIGAGLSGRRWVRTVNKNTDVDAIVSFIGAPSLSKEELAQMPKRPKFIAESRSSARLKKLFESKAIEVAVVARFVFPAPVEGRPKQARQWFDKYFQVITASDAALLPESASE